MYFYPSQSMWLWISSIRWLLQMVLPSHWSVSKKYEGSDSKRQGISEKLSKHGLVHGGLNNCPAIKREVWFPNIPILMFRAQKPGTSSGINFTFSMNEMLYAVLRHSRMGSFPCKYKPTSLAILRENRIHARYRLKDICVKPQLCSLLAFC